jgi:AcrR family transcriptional regulator
MQDIVKESGLSPGAIYRYFASKEAIVAALADERHARESGLLDEALAAGGLAGALRRLLATFFAPLSKPKEREERRLGIQLWAEALRDKDVRKVVRQGVDEPRRALSAFVTEAAKRGDLPPGVDADSLARAFIALFHGIILQQAWDEKVDVEAYVATLDLIVSALAKTGVSRSRGRR